MQRLDWKTQMREWPMKRIEFDFDRATTALVIVDMQRYGCDEPDETTGLNRRIAASRPDMAEAWFSSLRETVVPNIARLLDHFRRHALPVVYFTLGTELPDGRDASPVLAQRGAFSGSGGKVTRHKGSRQHEVIDAVRPREGELVLNKTTMSGFVSTGCDQIFRHMRLRHLVFTGVGTDACVFGTARDAADRGYLCAMVEDACTAQHPVLHDASLLIFATTCGRVATTDEVLSEL